jgi:hypothetical protein
MEKLKFSYNACGNLKWGSIFNLHVHNFIDHLVNGKVKYGVLSHKQKE